MISETAMLLAAGEGRRLRPLTLMKPKPLFEVGGRSMLDRALDRLRAAGVQRVVVNVCYLADRLVEALRARRDLEIVISREAQLLDTGGGIKNVLPLFEGKPFFALNADLVALDGKLPSLTRLRAAWDPVRMDALLLMSPTGTALGFGPLGDFNLEADGRLWRRPSAPPRSHVWIGTQILKPSLFEGVAEDVFSNNRIWDGIEARRSLFGLCHDGAALHVGTPEDWAKANALFRAGAF